MVEGYTATPPPHDPAVAKEAGELATVVFVMNLKRLGFSAAALFLAAMAFHEALTTPIWSPRDEIAHFDFIDHLASLRYPEPSDPITDYTARLCRDEFDWYKPRGYDGSKESMGLAGWSYESQSPPFYYALLAPILRATKALGAESTVQVLVLRVAGVTFFVVGALLFLPIFVELERTLRIPRTYGAWLALISLATNHTYVASIGNDVLSIPLSGAAFYFALRSWRSALPSDLIALSLVAAAASVTKLTNVPLLILPVIAVVSAHVRPRNRHVTPWVWTCLPLALLPLLFFLATNVVASGHLLGSAEARNVFATFVKPVRPVGAFLGTMVADAFNLQSFGIGLRPEIKLGLATLMLLGILQSLAWIAMGSRRPEAVLHLISAGAVALTMAVALLLNELIPGVHWHAFRHYYVIFPVWVFAFLSFPMRLFCSMRHDRPRWEPRGKARSPNA